MACLKMSSSRITTFAGHPVPDCKLSYFCPRHCLRHGDFAHLFPLPSGRMHGRGCAYPGLSCTPRGLQELGLQRGPNPNLEPTLGRFITYEATSSFSVYCSSDFADCLTCCSAFGALPEVQAERMQLGKAEQASGVHDLKVLGCRDLKFKC